MDQFLPCGVRTVDAAKEQRQERQGPWRLSSRQSSRIAGQSHGFSVLAFDLLFNFLSTFVFPRFGFVLGRLEVDFEPRHCH